MNSFIKACEVWVPDTTGGVLELAGGLFGSATAFAAVSRTLCFGRGEGLPGRCWDEGRPIVLKQLADSYFRRAAAARDAGIHCAVAVPVFLREELRAVLVLFCGRADDAPARSSCGTTIRGSAPTCSCSTAISVPTVRHSRR